MSWLEDGARFEVDGVDGSHWAICGPHLEPDVELDVEPSEDLYEAPVKTAWTTTAFGEGARFDRVRFEPRDIVFAVHIYPQSREDWHHLESAWRRAWDYERQSMLRCITPLSGMRELRCQLRDAPQITTIQGKDPHLLGYSRAVMTVRAADPFWHAHPEESTVTATAGDGSAQVMVSNPADRPMWLRWLLEPGARWGVPDGLTARTLWLPQSFSSHVVAVDSHPLREQIAIAGQPNAWSAMNGAALVASVPPRTPPTPVTLRWQGATAGARATVFCDRSWTRPWGME